MFEHLKEEGYRVTYLPVDVSGVISLEALEEALDEETIFVSIMQVNNEIGTIELIEEAVQLIRTKAPEGSHTCRCDPVLWKNGDLPGKVKDRSAFGQRT